MITQNLTKYTEDGLGKWLPYTKLDNEGKEQVKGCISRYSKPESFSAKISWSAFRICNAIKSIFGQSDWQLTRKKMGKRIYESLFHSKINEQSKIAKEDLEKLSRPIQYAELIADLKLNVFLKANEKKVESDHNFSKVIEDFEKKFKYDIADAKKNILSEVKVKLRDKNALGIMLPKIIFHGLDI